MKKIFDFLRDPHFYIIASIFGLAGIVLANIVNYIWPTFYK